MSDKRRSELKSDESAVFLYHVVYSYERFDVAAQALFKLVQEAQRIQPNKKRKLFLDIEGHRNSNGGFDADMFELQNEFLNGFLAPFLSEIHAPLISTSNPKPQNNDIPDGLLIHSK